MEVRAGTTSPALPQPGCAWEQGLSPHAAGHVCSAPAIPGSLGFGQTCKEFIPILSTLFQKLEEEGNSQFII